jgi:hypothetical protein
MRFRTPVEPPEPMRGLEVPREVVDALGGGERPRVTITINRHTWKGRVANHAGPFLPGDSNVNRQAAGVDTGGEVEVRVELDTDPPVVIEPPDFARALDAEPLARSSCDHLASSHKRGPVQAIESAKPETRARRIRKAIAVLLDPQLGRSARSRTSVTLSTPNECDAIRSHPLKRSPCWQPSRTTG